MLYFSKPLLAIAIILLVVLPSFAQVSTEKPVGSTGWTLLQQRFSQNEKTCQVTSEVESSLFKVGVGSHGTFYVAVSDMFLIQQLSSVGLWQVNSTYRAQLYIGKGGPINLEGRRFGEHSVMVTVPYSVLSRLADSSSVALNLNGLAMRGYRLLSTKSAVAALLKCAKAGSIISP